MSSEYIFFDEALRDRFVRFLTERGIACASRSDEIAGSVVEFPDDLPDEVLDAIEAEYETLLDEQMTQAPARDGWVTHAAVGISVTLADGRAHQVRLPPDIARRLLERFSVDEVHELVTAIARSLENPVDGPLCHKPD